MCKLPSRNETYRIKMRFLELFKRNKKSKTEIVKAKNPSPEQILFAETALEIISPTVEKYGFKRHRTEIEKYSIIIIYRNDNKYIKIISSNYPTDYPYYYNIVLGEGDSEDFYEWDWNSIDLWRMKSEIEPKTKASEYKFPIGDSVKLSLENANLELEKFGLTFLIGDLNLFRELRKELNGQREPYKILSPDRNGHLEIKNEPKSIKQKKKNS